MNPTIANTRAPTTFHNRAIAIRRPLIVTVHGYHFGALDQYTAFIQDLEGQIFDEPHIASGTGDSESEAVGHAFLDFADNTPYDHTLPYLLTPEQPASPPATVTTTDQKGTDQ